ncbi:MAG: ferrous iron transport protein B [candidate division Zixibacteria bacterium]|jgi:ferrous iron transport protein B|nr:ferrous iron transport protein B [candidate division Zixibacteria bacterium]
MLQPARSTASRTTTVAICGNPNCGKTTIFNAITGLRQRVGNYPGVTVEKVSGDFRLDRFPDKTFCLLDIPGSYSLAAFSPDEYIAARALFGAIDGEPAPDVIVCVIDATQLERGLYLLFQVMQIGRPVVVALNMIDLALRKGLVIDTKKLSTQLGGVPVVNVIGSRREGIDDLKAAIGEVSAAQHQNDVRFYDRDVEQAIDDIAAGGNDGYCTRAEYVRVLFDVDGPAEKAFLANHDPNLVRTIEAGRARLRDRFGTLSAAETAPLTQRAAAIRGEVVKAGKARKSRSDRIDTIVLHPVVGPVLLLLIMTLMFQSVFSWAEPVMNLVDGMFGWLANLVAGSMDDGPLRSLLTDGIIGGVGSVVIFLPQIVILFLFISLIEDSGYMPRAAFLVDRLFGWCGLSGKSFIPMLSSFACAVPGIMATRTIEDRKLRLITIMVSPLMACSARLPVYAIMIAAFIPHRTYAGILNSQGLVLTSLYLLGIVVAVLVSFTLKKLVFRSDRSSFVMELPSYKVPTPDSVLIRVYNRARSFLVRAGTVIAAITIIVWALSYYPRSSSIVAQYEVAQAAAETSHADELALLEPPLQEALAALEPVRRAEFAAFMSSLTETASDADAARVRAAFDPRSDAEQRAADLALQRHLLSIAHELRLSELEREMAGALLRHSYFARAGKALEPIFVHLGWDWKITMAVLASFPAREVIIATLGTIYNLGGDVDESSGSLVDKMRRATWEDGPRTGERVFSPAVALSVMVFFALCCQCGATVVTIRQEAGGWIYAVATFAYMTTLAFVGAFVTYNLFTWLGY